MPPMTAVSVSKTLQWKNWENNNRNQNCGQHYN
jgi:hypothetical protein